MSPDKKRRRPYIWPTWITKLMSGDDRCWWKTWYRAHNFFDRTPDQEDRAAFFAEYNKKHDAIVSRRHKELLEDGWVVKLEDEGEFKLEGDTCDVSGKPDIVAMKGDKALVIDAKSGKRRKSDHWQVLLYMFALPMAWLKDHELKGEVEYKDGRVPVRPLGKDERETIIQTIRRIASPDEPDASPSKFECRYCDVAACPVRHHTPIGDASEHF